MDFTGAIAGLAAAACWSIASVFYLKVDIGAGAMTTFKNTLAALFLFVMLVVSSAWRGEALFQASWDAWIQVGFSGIVGLCLCDIAYFRSLQILGARRALTLALLTPPSTALLGQYWLSESLSSRVWLAILTTILGIGIVMRERAERAPEQEVRPGSTRWGICCGLLAVVTMAVGSIALKQGTEDVGSIEGTFIRLFVASVFGIVLSGVLGQLPEIAKILRERKGLRDLSTATFVGTVLGVYLMLVCYQHCWSGIAATLTSTTPLFVIPVVIIAYRRSVSLLAIVGAAVAFAGVCGLLMEAS